MLRGSPHGQDFPLRTVVADQHHGQFAGLLVHLRHHPQLIRPARQTFDIELAERTASGRLARLIIFPSHEISRGIHATKLSHAMDNACPSENYSLDFRIIPATGVFNSIRWRHGGRPLCEASLSSARLFILSFCLSKHSLARAGA